MNKLKKTILNLIYFFLYYSGICFVLRLVNRKKIRILMYHGVADNQSSFNMEDPSEIISIENFSRQVKYLSRAYNIISLNDLINHINEKATIPANSLILTFDDGLKNNYTNAFPVLKEHKMTAIFFLITDYIDTNKISWDNEYHYLSRKINSCKLEEEFKKRFSEYAHFVEKANPDNRIEDIRIALKYKIDETDRMNFVRNLYRKYKVEIPKEEIQGLYLSWNEINDMVNSDFSFGSHSSSHRVLSMLNHKELEKELTCSKKIIEDKIGKKIVFFAYPYGFRESFNTDAKKILRDNGLLAAVSTINGYNNKDTDLFELKRICVYDEPFYIFKLRLERLDRFIDSLYHKILR